MKKEKKKTKSEKLVILTVIIEDERILKIAEILKDYERAEVLIRGFEHNLGTIKKVPVTINGNKGTKFVLTTHKDFRLLAGKKN